MTEGKKHINKTEKWTWLTCTTYLYNSWITRKSVLRFWWFRHSDVFNVTSSENNIFVDFFFRWHRSVCVSILCPIGFNCREIKVTKELSQQKKTQNVSPPGLLTYLWLMQSWTSRYQRRTISPRIESVPWKSSLFYCRCKAFLPQRSCLQRKGAVSEQNSSRSTTNHRRNRRPTQSPNTCALYRKSGDALLGCTSTSVPRGIFNVI